MIRNVIVSALSVLIAAVCGCTEPVPAGKVGRVKTASGWEKEILKPGNHTCWGRDVMYLLETTNKSYKETLNILVGGKVNLKVDFTVRVRVNTDDEALMSKSFEAVQTKDNCISVDSMYDTYLKMKAQAIPRSIFEMQPDVQTAVANSPKLAADIRKQITGEAKATPLIVEDAQITNYDWPESITKAQEELVKVQLKEAAEEAQVRADLKRAEGRLKVEEANKLVELKKAEAIAGSIDIIKAKLAGAPEYLMWHQVVAMKEAANGPNNCFILYPYATDANQVKSMVNNANLVQMLKSEGPDTEQSKKPATPQVSAKP